MRRFPSPGAAKLPYRHPNRKTASHFSGSTLESALSKDAVDRDLRHGFGPVAQR